MNDVAGNHLPVDSPRRPLAVVVDMRLSVVDFPTVKVDTVPAGLGRWTFAGDVDGLRSPSLLSNDL